MSYQKHADGKITLTMSQSDYDFLVLLLGEAATSRLYSEAESKRWAEFLHALNEGNPECVAYAIPTRFKQGDEGYADAVKMLKKHSTRIGSARGR